LSKLQTFWNYVFLTLCHLFCSVLFCSVLSPPPILKISDLCQLVRDSSVVRRHYIFFLECRTTEESRTKV
jgi:hypothetical protein